MKNKIFITIFGLIFTIITINFVLAEDGGQSENDLSSVVNNAPTITPNLIIPIATNNKIGLIDSDSDGVIDFLDKYPGEDDFAFENTDDNKNGIVDSLEYLQIRQD